MIWTKGSHQSAKFQTFGFSRKISPNLYFDRLLIVYKILAERYRGFVSHDPEDWCKIWRKTDLLFQKWQEFGEISPEHSSQVSETCSFICSYSAKYLMFDLRKYRGVTFHDTEGWCKIWRKTDLWFRKWHEEYGKFSPEHLKVPKLGFWWDPLIQSRKSMSLKSTEELWVMTMKNDAKFEEELTCHLKIDMRNLTIFNRSTWKSQKLSF